LNIAKNAYIIIISHLFRDCKGILKENSTRSRSFIKTERARMEGTLRTKFALWASEVSPDGEVEGKLHEQKKR
jgi:hypothetical protein